MRKEDLMKLAQDAIVNSDEDQALTVIGEVLADDFDLIEILQTGFASGNLKVGEMFEKGELTLPELIFSTEVMKRVIEIVEERIPLGEARGRVLIATVEGDVHDIGKGIVASTMKSYGIEVIDLGRDIPAEVIVQKAQEYNVDIIATSALLTSTLTEQKKVENLLKKQGLHDRFLTMVGGAPCTARWAKRIGADAYTIDAVAAAKTALKLLKPKI